MDGEADQWRVVIASKSVRSAELADTLSGAGGVQASASLVLEYPVFQFRSADPAVLVATVAAASSAFAALVTALLQRLAAKDGQHIAMEFESGAKLDVPADIDPERLEQLIRQVDGRPERLILLLGGP